MRIRSLLALACVLAAAAAPARADLPDEPGAPSMENFEHVFNYPMPGGPPADQGSDLEFFTATVPLRNYTTGEKILDASGNEIPVTRDFAVVGGQYRGAYVFDITDVPGGGAPQLVRFIPCNQYQNDVQVKQFGSRWVLALTTDQGPMCATPRLGSGNGALSLFDVTDPYDYAMMYAFRVTGGAHNFTFHPTRPYGYVSTGDLPGGRNHLPIIDFTDLANPVRVADIVSVGGPHDISFNAEGTRAYVASENNGRIYDTTDPPNPVLIGVAPSPGTYAHGLDASPDGRIMVMTEESLALGGFFVEGSGVCPGEGLVLFLIEGALERAPVPLSYFLAGVAGKVPDSRACTAHVGDISPNSKVMVTGWYVGGVRAIDISDPLHPVEIGHAVMPGAEVWSAKMYKGPYVYDTDEGRGFDVFRWTGPVPFGN